MPCDSWLPSFNAFQTRNWCCGACYARDPDFRELSEHYDAAFAALHRFEAPETASAERAAEYRRIVAELEAEIAAILAANEPPNLDSCARAIARPEGRTMRSEHFENTKGQPMHRRPKRKPARRLSACWARQSFCGGASLVALSAPAIAQEQKKPNILFIMGDDIGWMQTSYYHRGLMIGETPNIDSIAQEGMAFTDYYAEASCTSGRNAFFTGMTPLRTGMTVPQLPGSPAYLRPGTPALAKFLLDLGYNTGEFGKNHLGDHPEALPTAHGFQEFWGYLYHLDAMQQVSFPDINKSPTEQTVAPPCMSTPIPGVPDALGAVDPATTTCLTPPRPMLACTSSDGTEANQIVQGRRPADAGAVEDHRRGNLVAGHRLPRPQRPRKDRQAVLRLVQPGADACDHRAARQVHGHGRREGRQGLGRQRSRHEADGRQHRLCPARSSKDMGELDNTIVVFTTDNGAEKISYPDGGVSPFKGQKGEAWEGGFRAPMMIRWPGHVEAGKWTNQIFSSLDWLPTLVDIAGGPKANDLRTADREGRVSRASSRPTSTASTSSSS